MNTWNFFLRGNLKPKVYHSLSKSIHDLKNNIKREIENVDITRKFFKKFVESLYPYSKYRGWIFRREINSKNISFNSGVVNRPARVG